MIMETVGGCVSLEWDNEGGSAVDLNVDSMRLESGVKWQQLDMRSL